MNFTVICFVKGRRNIFRFHYPDPIVDVRQVLSDFQRDFLEQGFHPADINWLELYDHVARKAIVINSQSFGNQPLYFDGSLS